MIKVMHSNLLPIFIKARRDLLEEIINYDYYDCCSCNLGIIAQLILDIDTVGLRKILKNQYLSCLGSPTWQIMLNKYENGDKELNYIFSSLFKYGLNNEDINYIENISLNTCLHKEKRYDYSDFLCFLDEQIFNLTEQSII